MTLVDVAVGFCKKGHRPYQEDALFPALEDVKASNQIWVVCDGVGGNPCGGRASQLVSNKTAEYLQKNPDATALCTYLDQTVAQHASETKSCRGMATTLTFLQCLNEGIRIGWCGDSRIYQFRDGEILYRTQDHSLVQELVQAGELTEKEARTDYRNNIITRAIGIQQNEIDYHEMKDVRKNDYFFLCTDGVTEALDDQQLSRIFISCETELIQAEILRACDRHATDNYTA
jgi:protein phosphatase